MGEIIKPGMMRSTIPAPHQPALRILPVKVIFCLFKSVILFFSHSFTCIQQSTIVQLDSDPAQKYFFHIGLHEIKTMELHQSMDRRQEHS